MTNLTFLWLFLVFVLAVTVIKAHFALRKKKPFDSCATSFDSRAWHPVGNRFFNRKRKNVWEFKKLRRVRQRKRHIKIELCVRLIVLSLLHVGHVVRSSVLSLSWHEWFSCEGKE